MPHNQFPSTQRRKAWVRITILFALIALALTALPATALAGTDTAGNVLATDNDATPSGVEGDLYWACLLYTSISEMESIGMRLLYISTIAV